MHLLTAIRIALIALTASLVFSFLLFPILVEPQRANIDPDRFGELALSISQGNGFVYEKGGEPVLERTPLYSYVVAGLFMLAGGFSLPAVQVLQALIHAVTSFVVYVVALRMFEKRAALLAQLLFALHPIAIWYTARIWVETMHTLLLCVVAFSFILLLELPSTKRALILGIAIGLSCLTKSILLLFPFVVLLILLFRLRAEGVRTGAIVLLATLAVVFPWTLRNCEVSRQFLPVNTSLGFNLVYGAVIGEHWPSRDYFMLDYWRMASERTDSLLAPGGVQWESVEGDGILIRLAFENYLQSPLKFVRHVASNFLTFWYLSESNLKSAFIGVLQLSVLMLAAISFFRLQKDGRRKLLTIVVLIFYYVTVNVSIVGLGRYSMPMIPFLLLISAPLLDKILFKRATR